MLKQIWELCCSLKLAIYLASAATLLLMGGSLLIPFNPAIFGTMDQMELGRWMSKIASMNLQKTWWFYLVAILLILFGLNTLCCFIDWFRQLRSRWRKSGEYLLHLGVVLILIAYIWGNFSGWRHISLQCQIGALTPLPEWPGHYLRVDKFEPIFGTNGPPQDMISDVSILRGDEVLYQQKVQINQPLLKNGLVITPVSFGRQPIGFQVAIPGRRPIDMISGRGYQLSDGSLLQVLRFLPDARKQANGEISYRNDRIGNPAFELKYTANDGSHWQGWYFLRSRLPKELTARGLFLRPLAPIHNSYSSLTVNYDPGAPLAAIGSILMSIGVLIALFSFYRKRRNNDRPAI